MYEVNTKLYSIQELEHVKYGNLLKTVEELIELVEELEYNVNEIEEIEEEQGFLDFEMLNEFNFFNKQLEYLYKNIDTIISVMDYQESKSFFDLEGLPPMCLN